VCERADEERVQILRVGWKIGWLVIHQDLKKREARKYSRERGEPNILRERKIKKMSAKKKKNCKKKIQEKEKIKEQAESCVFVITRLSAQRTAANFYSSLAQSVCKRSDARIIEFGLSAKFGAPR